MAEKMECPGCRSYSSSINRAVLNGEPCPNCGLPALIILEVEAVQNLRIENDLKERHVEVLIYNGRLRTEVTLLRCILADVKYALRDA